MLARLGERDRDYVLSHAPPMESVERAWRMQLLRGCVQRAVFAMVGEAHRAVGARLTRELASLPLATVRVPVDPQLGADGILSRLRALPSVVCAAARPRDLARARAGLVAAGAAAGEFSDQGQGPLRWDAGAPRAQAAEGAQTEATPLVGVIERGRPDLLHPAVRALVPAHTSTAGDPLLHPHATGVAIALFEAALAPAPPAVFLSVTRDCRQAGWLAAADALALRGAQVVNLSAGVRLEDLADGWELWERALALLSALHGVTVVAAAGAARVGPGLLAPARDPALLAVGAAEQLQAYGPDRPELLATERAPLGNAPGTSFASPRIAAMAAHATALVPRARVDGPLTRALLLAARPPLGRVPDPARLQRMAARGWFAWGAGDAQVPLPAAGTRALTATLAWGPWALDELLLAGDLAQVEAPSLEVATVAAGLVQHVRARSRSSWAHVETAVAERPALHVRSRGVPWALAWHLEDAVTA